MAISIQLVRRFLQEKITEPLVNTMGVCSILARGVLPILLHLPPDPLFRGSLWGLGRAGSKNGRFSARGVNLIWWRARQTQYLGACLKQRDRGEQWRVTSQMARVEMEQPTKEARDQKFKWRVPGSEITIMDLGKVFHYHDQVFYLI